MRTDILIIGAGPAGLNAAKAACKTGKKIIIAGAEPYLPYWRPRLPDIIRNGNSIESILMQQSDWYTAHNIEVLTQKEAVKIDITAKMVFWKDNTSTEYSILIIACGSAANVPKFPLAEEIHVLRTYDDACFIREECMKKKKAFVVGGGVLGLETAFAIADTGCKVSVSDISEYPLPRQLDREGGLFFKDLMEKKGIHIYCAESTEAMEKDVREACIIAAAGVHSLIAIANDCGISVNRGILVDEYMKTSEENIYACGDVAEFTGVKPGLITIAAAQGKIAGENVAGVKNIYRPVLPSPSITVAGISVLSLGSMEVREDSKIYRKRDKENYSAVVVSKGMIKGAAFVGDTGLGLKFKKIIETGENIEGVSSFEDIVKIVNDR